MTPSTSPSNNPVVAFVGTYTGTLNTFCSSFNYTDPIQVRIDQYGNVDLPWSSQGRLVDGVVDATGTISGMSIGVTSLSLGSFSIPFTASTNGTRLTASGSAGGISSRINLSLSAGATLNGSPLDDRLLGGFAGDLISAQGGDDSLLGGAGADTMLGGAGDDYYRVDHAGDRVVETTSLGASVDAGGIDRVKSTRSMTLGDFVENLVLAGAVAFRGIGNALDNTLIGNAIANLLQGKAGNDRLVGNAGADTLNGGAGSDTLKGGAGNDTYVLYDGNDRVIEFAGKGMDTVKSAVGHVLAANVERLILMGSAATRGSGNGLNNRLQGNAAGNRLAGKKGNDTLVGNGGADVLNGGAGDDVLQGNGGNDLLMGAGGRDRLWGGRGADRFRIINATSGVDSLMDFNPGQNDRLQVLSKNFGGLARGALAADHFVANSTGVAQDNNDYFVFNTRSRMLYFDPDANGSQSAVAIARLNGTGLSHGDIVVI
jgi:Ca2+-binding RTX toxin-like protein